MSACQIMGIDKDEAVMQRKEKTIKKKEKNRTQYGSASKQFRLSFVTLFCIESMSVQPSCSEGKISLYL